MVKIIEPGKKKTDFPPYNIDMTCPHCECKFRLEPGDPFEEGSEYDPRDGQTTKYAVGCPNTDCGHRFTRYC